MAGAEEDGVEDGVADGGAVQPPGNSTEAGPKSVGSHRSGYELPRAEARPRQPLPGKHLRITWSWQAKRA